MAQRSNLCLRYFAVDISLCDSEIQYRLSVVNLNRGYTSLNRTHNGPIK